VSKLLGLDGPAEILLFLFFQTSYAPLQRLYLGAEVGQVVLTTENLTHCDVIDVLLDVELLVLEPHEVDSDVSLFLLGLLLFLGQPALLAHFLHAIKQGVHLLLGANGTGGGRNGRFGRSNRGSFRVDSLARRLRLHPEILPIFGVAVCPSEVRHCYFYFMAATSKVVINCSIVRAWAEGRRALGGIYCNN
jgi:hypothetical protein